MNALLRRLETGRPRRLAVTISALCATIVVVAGATAAVTSSDTRFDDAKLATAPFNNLDVALAAGYGSFYKCTDEEGLGAMGQHYVKGPLVDDPRLNSLRPEVLVYEPRGAGRYRLVAVEYVTIKEAWDKKHSRPPSLFGRQLTLVPAPNRYGLPDFYQLHVWLWEKNPRGIFEDWNPRVSCRGLGD